MRRPTRSSRRGGAVVIVSVSIAVLALAISACGSPSQPAASPAQVSGGPTGHYVVASGIHKIKHIIVIEQENRSFDSYFGTYPGATGFRRRTACRRSACPSRRAAAKRPITTRRM